MRSTLILAAGILLASFAGCASEYVTPGGPAPIGEMTTRSVGDRMNLKPESPWPAALAFTRVQASDYRSYSASGVDRGGVSMVSAKDLERDSDLTTISKWPGMRDAVRLAPIIVPSGKDTLLALREGAATLRTDILALYTIDTDFRVDNGDIGPLGILTLGLAPTRNAVVHTTASLAFFDVRTGFCFGTAEGSATEDQLANAWTSQQATDDVCRRAERQAFEEMLVEAGKVWTALNTSRTPVADVRPNGFYADIPF